jgi:L-fucose mutarotase/ribose pyranase (RbsD/FucU family)
LGHLDDLIVAHADPSYLNQISAHMHYLFRLVKWEINYTKSVLNPALKILFLGAVWSPLKVVRTKNATDSMRYIWSQIRYLKSELKGKPLQRVRGFLNYYVSFAGNFFSIVNKILLIKDRRPYDKIFSYLINQDTIHLNIPRLSTARSFVNFASDATETQIAALQMDDPANFQIKVKYDNILVNELNAAMLSLQMADDFIDDKLFSEFVAGERSPKGERAARLYIDNNAVIALINRGRVKWSLITISIFKLFNFLKKIESYRLRFPFVAVYIATGSNPADALSRKLL